MTLDATQEDQTTETTADEAAASGDTGTQDQTDQVNDQSTEQAGQADEAANEAGAELEWGDEFKGEDGKLDLAKVNAALKDLGEADGKRAELLGEVPEKPEDYKLELTEEVKLPDGEKIEFDAEDEATQELTKWAHERGLGQKALSELLTMHAKQQLSVVNEAGKASQEQVQAEIAKLGDQKTAEARVSAILTSAEKILGDSDKAFALVDMARTKEQFEAIEALVTKSSGGRTPGGGAGETAQRTSAEVLYPQYANAKR